ncbi:MAG TPA: ABC transporter ATP-binding protein [Verrucomicrobiae bacterium]
MSKQSKPVLAVEALTIIRNTQTILDDVSWEVKRGEHWVILGANGSGKTSLLSSLAGYMPPTSGEMAVFDRVYGETDWRELRRRIGLVSSSIRQMMADTETGLETVASGKYAMIDFWGPVKRADKVRALEILKQVECEYLAKRPWLYLSQGERQRVLIGRAMMAQPHLLILDEPCAGLDPVARENFLHFLERLATSPSAPTLVLVTHHVEEIAPAFTHVLMLKGGKVLAAGEKKKVLTAKLLGEAFGAQVKLRSRAGIYSLTVGKARTNVII